MIVNLAPGRAVAATLMMLSCSAALAGEATDWNFGGFGTLGAAHSNNDQADFTGNALSPGADGAKHNPALIACIDQSALDASVNVLQVTP